MFSELTEKRRSVNPVVALNSALDSLNPSPERDAVKSMPSPGSIQGWPSESIVKRLGTAFLWEHTVE